MVELREKAPSFMANGNLRLIIFGGKGGVGKTTSSAATALCLAQQNPKKRILVISTDPAHSLGDSFDCPLGGEILPIKGVDNLWGLEVDASAAMADYKRKHERAIKTIAERGTFLDDSEINEFFELTLPGMDEIMAIIQMANILKEGIYDLFIMDTAPTGHTLRLLSLPVKMHRWAEVLNFMQAKHRYISKVFTGKYRKDFADAFIEMAMADVDQVNALLKDSKMVEFVPVMTPEPMSIIETEKLVNILNSYNIMVKNIIINRVAMERECPFCESRQRDQEDYLLEIREKFGCYNLIRMPLFPHQIQGLEGLTQFAEVLSGNGYQEQFSHSPKPMAEASHAEVKLSDLLELRHQLLVFGG
ncbi:MAG: ArsA family ATPase, partial [Dehalococcoidales bacterium]|nr:ArsA family ATPase [Dehalococcoidales bacterium]